MNWSLVPLMVGAIGFGWLGSWLQATLAPALGETEVLPALIDPRGLLAFALGAVGFGLAWWYFVRRADAVAPAIRPPEEERAPAYRAARWVSGLADAGYWVSSSLSRVQSGGLPRYALGSFIGLALVLLIREAIR